MRRHRTPGWLGVALAALIVAGCGTSTVSAGVDHADTRATTAPTVVDQANSCVSAGGNCVDSYVGTPPVTVDILAPASVSVRAYITMGGYTATERDATTIAFSLQKGDTPVLPGAGTEFVCDGAKLTQSLAVAVPTAQVAGQPFTCTLTAGGTTASLRFTLPVAPRITQPADGAQVRRDLATTVSYQIPPGQLSGVVALGTGTKTFTTGARASATSATVDTAALAAGPGNITLSEQLDPPAITASGFAAVAVQGMAMTIVAVTWT